ncbi:MAG: hypothetical protein HC845_15235 [Akkermansiaceae bacterium]|nr:hypothetical protein [Akkermansiaceae bacterium]
MISLSGKAFDENKSPAGLAPWEKMVLQSPFLQISSDRLNIQKYYMLY